VNTDCKSLSYVLVTPAHNEEEYIEKTIQSVISQTVLPEKWVIVSDGSTDHTDEIVKKYCEGYRWIELLRMPEHRDRQFAAKVHCFKAGYARVKDIKYDIIGNLDADISFDKDYFEFLLEKLSQMHRLGVAGTPFVEDGYSSVTDSFEGAKHVAGGCQLFRRTCFEEIGGYIPNKGGGIDWIAVTTARMKGWETQSFREKYFFHYRRLGTGGSNTIRSIFSYGEKDYFLGGHPLWEMFRVLYRMKKKPYVLGSLILISGYCWAALSAAERPVSPELMKFHQEEQMQKLRLILKSVLTFNKIDKYDLNS
jgi:glycosyltransferase involved in cell wall biosynthesis